MVNERGKLGNPTLLGGFVRWEHVLETVELPPCLSGGDGRKPPVDGPMGPAAGCSKKEIDIFGFCHDSVCWFTGGIHLLVDRSIHDPCNEEESPSY